MNYKALNKQQKYVLSEVYEVVNRDYCRLKPEGFTEYCTHCRCNHIDGEIKREFEALLMEARNSNVFSSIFAGWNGDREIVGLFGVLNDTDELVLLGEYAIQGIVPSYNDRLSKLQDRYRAYWPGRLILVTMLIMGIYFSIPFFDGLIHPLGQTDIPLSALFGYLSLAITCVGGWFSIKKYLLLFR